MSFWLGVILKDQVVLLIDRWEISLKSTRIPIPWFFRVKEKTKYLRLNDRCVFLPAGHVNTSEKLFEIFKNHFGDKPFLLEELTHFQWEFKEEAARIWDPVKKANEEDCKRFGYGVGGVDVLLAGVDRSQVSFIINISDVDKFELHIYEQAGNWFSLPQGPAVDEMVGDGVREFLGAAMPLDERSQREEAKRRLGQLFLEVKRRNKFISSQHDLLLIGNNTEVWSFSPLIGHYRRLRPPG